MDISQPGLGDFGKLPPEVRLMIWHELMPQLRQTPQGFGMVKPTPGFNDELGGSPHYKGPDEDLEPPEQGRLLSILQGSKHLYLEISSMLYHNRAICFYAPDYTDVWAIDLSTRRPLTTSHLPWFRYRKIVFEIFGGSWWGLLHKQSDTYRELETVISKLNGPSLTNSFGEPVAARALDVEVKLFPKLRLPSHTRTWIILLTKVFELLKRLQHVRQIVVFKGDISSVSTPLPLECQVRRYREGLKEWVSIRSKTDISPKQLCVLLERCNSELLRKDRQRNEQG